MRIVEQTPDATLGKIREQLPVHVSIQTVHAGEQHCPAGLRFEKDLVQYYKIFLPRLCFDKFQPATI